MCEYKGCKTASLKSQDFCIEHIAPDNHFLGVESNPSPIVERSIARFEDTIAADVISCVCIAAGPVGWLALALLNHGVYNND